MAAVLGLAVLAALFLLAGRRVGELFGYVRATADTTVDQLTDQLPEPVHDRKMEHELKTARQELIDRQVQLTLSRGQVDELVKRRNVRRLCATGRGYGKISPQAERERSCRPRLGGDAMNKTYEHVSTGRRLTAEEAARVRQLRDQLDQEKPETIARAKGKLDQVAELDRVFAELKRCREQKGLSLSDVQKLTEIDRSVISKLETGKRTNYTIDTVLRYAEALGKKVVVSLVDAK